MSLTQFATRIRNSLSKGSEHGLVPFQAMGTTIPKVVHQTYHSKILPNEIQKNLNLLKTMNPEWEFKLYDDADIEHYISSFYPDLLGTFHKINPKYGAAKADFFRYLLMYREGGVYLDIKSSLSRPLKEIINPDDKYILTHWTQYSPEFKLGYLKGITNPHGELHQWHIIAVKGHPFLKHVIENVCRNIDNYNSIIHGCGKMAVLKVTGPIAYTETITPLLDKYPNRLVLSHEDIGLTYSFMKSYDGHHKFFEQVHYTKLEEPIIEQSALVMCLFNISKPAITMAKSLYRFYKYLNEKASKLD